MDKLNRFDQLEEMEQFVVFDGWLYQFVLERDGQHYPVLVQVKEL